MVYRYSKITADRNCKHIWGEPDNIDQTQFCEICGHWRCPVKIKDEEN